MEDQTEAVRRVLDQVAGATMAHRTILGLLIAGLQGAEVIDAEAVRTLFGSAESLLTRHGNAAAITEAGAVETVVQAMLAPPATDP